MSTCIFRQKITTMNSLRKCFSQLRRKSTTSSSSSRHQNRQNRRRQSFHLNRRMNTKRLFMFWSKNQIRSHKSFFRHLSQHNQRNRKFTLSNTRRKTNRCMVHRRKSTEPRLWHSKPLPLFGTYFEDYCI